MARHIGVKYVVRSTTATGGAYNYASSLGIPSILIERGGHSYWTWEEVEQDKRDVRHLVFHLQGKACHGLKHYRQMLLENVSMNMRRIQDAGIHPRSLESTSLREKN